MNQHKNPHPWRKWQPSAKTQRAARAQAAANFQTHNPLLDYGFAEGNYDNECCLCLMIFTGDKRANTCKSCAQSLYDYNNPHPSKSSSA